MASLASVWVLVLLALRLEPCRGFTHLVTHKVLGSNAIRTRAIMAATTSNEDAVIAKINITPRLGFLSFDLDDTLFPTSRVVNNANDVMVQKMQQLGFFTTVEEFLQTTREIRSQLHKPITYTALRKLAIQGEMERLNGTAAKDPVAVVEEFYNAWLQERHAAAEQYLFSDAIETLETLQQTYPDVCIAAITNGAGNPLHMSERLERLFEFCVSGEDDDVFPHRKPHSGIYQVALRRYQDLYPHHCHQHLSEDGASANSIRHIWCHVGDCLANDVAASAACGAYAVWMDTEFGEETAAARLVTTGDEASNKPQWSTATASDIQQRTELANQGKEKVAARIFSLSKLVDVIDELLQQNST